MTGPVKSVAKALGVGVNLIHRWRKIYTPKGDRTKVAEHKDEIQAFHIRIAELEEANDRAGPKAHLLDLSSAIAAIRVFLWIKRARHQMPGSIY